MATALHVGFRQIKRYAFKSYIGPPSFQKSNTRWKLFSSATNTEQKAETEQPPLSENMAPEDGKPNTAKFEEENKLLLEQVKTIDDKYKRSLAENENIRVRMRKQIEEAKRFSIQNFCKDLIDVADVLDTAMDTVPKDELVDTNPHLKNLHQGLSMTEAQLQSIFRRYGLTKINPLGEKFDPNQHEALFELDNENKEPGSVAVVTKLGYKLHERTIRPALVGVVKRRP